MIAALLQINALLDKVENVIALGAFLGVGLLTSLVLSQRRDIARLTAFRERVPDHAKSDFAASEARLDRAEGELEELFAERGEPVTGSEAIAATEVHPGGLPAAASAGRSPADRLTSERPALERLTMERAALDPHPHYRGLRERLIRPHWLAAIAVVAALVAVAAVVGSENLLSSEDGGSTQRAGDVDPASVTVAVLNGTAVQGLADKVASDIEPNGYRLGSIGNVKGNFPQTVVYFQDGPGSKGEARAVADVLGRKTPVQPITRAAQRAAGYADVVVIAGEDRGRL